MVMCFLPCETAGSKASRCVFLFGPIRFLCGATGRFWSDQKKKQHFIKNNKRMLLQHQLNQESISLLKEGERTVTKGFSR